MKRIAFYNPKDSFDKAFAVYNLAWMLNEMGYRVLLVDLNPQMNLTQLIVPPEKIILLGAKNYYLDQGLEDLFEKDTDPSELNFISLNENLLFHPGHVMFGNYEDSIYTILEKYDQPNEPETKQLKSWLTLLSFNHFQGDLILFDLGPGRSTLTDSALIISDHVINPVSPDPISLLGLVSFGQLYQGMNVGYQDVYETIMDPEFQPDSVKLIPTGYFLYYDSGLRYQNWANKNAEALIPNLHLQKVWNEEGTEDLNTSNDPFCLGKLKAYPGLKSMALDANKPIFRLLPADGAIGSHVYAVQDAYKQTLELAKKIAERCELPPPEE